MTEEQEREVVARASSKDLFAQVRETLVNACDEYNHRGDFWALDELEERLAQLQHATRRVEQAAIYYGAGDEVAAAIAHACLVAKKGEK